MTIGMGIALFGVWMVPLFCVTTREVTGFGVVLSMPVALMATVIICGSV